MTDRVIAGRYRLEEEVGAGGMSEVWRATDLELERTVAVKLLAPDADPARFEREARAVAALAHPSIGALYDYGEAGERPFIVLEYLPGGTLEDRLAGRRPLPDEETARIAREIAAGLAHAHERGIVHRDLKPSNILFDAEGRPKIADFGIARVGEAGGSTEAGTVLGTAAYISPEQVAGREATPASDVYAFGVILFRMLTGRLPFESPDALAVAAMHRDTPPPSVSEIRPDAPARLESLAAATLAKSPADRPQDGAGLLTELGGRAPSGGSEESATQVMRPPKRKHNRTAVVLVAAAALAAGGVGVAIAVTSRGGATTTPPSTSQPTTTQGRSTASTAVSLPPATTETQTTSTAETATTTPPATTEPATTTTAATTPPPLTTLPTTTTAPPPPPPPTTDTTPATTTEPTTTTDTTPTTTAATPTTPTEPG